MQNQIFIHDTLFPQTDSEEIFQKYFKTHPEFDPEYILQHCDLYRRETREWVESIWDKYRDFAEPDFLIHVRETDRFHRFTWQAYLASVLIDKKYKLEKNSGYGPDLQIKLGNKNIWIEATTTSAGDDISASGLPQSGAIYDALDPRVARISNALTKKYEIYKEKYLSKICAEDEPFIIAINGSETNSMQEAQAAEATVYARGNDVIIHSDFKSQGGFYELREAVVVKKKDKLVTIPSNYFCNDFYKEISAIIYSEQHIINANNHGRTPEGCLYLLLNPYARNKIDPSKFSIGNLTQMTLDRQIIREYEKTSVN